MNHTTYGDKGTEIISGKIKTTKDSGITSENIALKTAEYLARGQKVREIKPGVSGLNNKVKTKEYFRTDLKKKPISFFKEGL